VKRGAPEITNLCHGQERSSSSYYNMTKWNYRADRGSYLRHRVPDVITNEEHRGRGSAGGEWGISDKPNKVQKGIGRYKRGWRGKMGGEFARCSNRAGTKGILVLGGVCSEGFADTEKNP